MRTSLTSLIFFHLFGLQSNARTFLQSHFATAAQYEDMAGSKYESQTTGTVRISDDLKLCAIDLPTLGIRVDCQATYRQRTYGIELNADIVRKIIQLSIDQKRWPKDVSTRSAFLLRKLNSIRLDYNNLYYQLHDTIKADALHVSFSLGYNWTPY